jgi:hypothetical protein
MAMLQRAGEESTVPLSVRPAPRVTMWIPPSEVTQRQLRSKRLTLG